jgi:uncharacterized protein
MSENAKPAFGPGSFCWHELHTRDVKKAQEFYSKVLGWKFEPWGPPGQYWMIATDADPGPDKMRNIVGGFMGMDDPQWGELPSHWGYYIDLDNVDETAGRVEGLGGKLMHPPTDIPEVGRFAVVQDPTGAFVNIMTVNEHAPGPPHGNPGHFIWVELMTRGFDKAKAFYSELIGWKLEEMPVPGGEGVYTLFQNRNGNAGGGMEMPNEVPAEVPGHWMGYIHVPDIDATVKAVEAAVGTVLMPVLEVPGIGRMTAIQDPTGAAVSVMTPAREMM